MLIRPDDPTLMMSVKRHEGFSQHPYFDSEGVETIGYGRNLRDNGISRQEAEFLLQNDLRRALLQAMDAAPGFADLPEEAQRVLVEMAFQLGGRGLRGFRRMLSAIARRDWRAAAEEMLDSRWAQQTPQRAQELAERIRRLHGDESAAG